jgi:histidine triad (HIT) family protein
MLFVGAKVADDLGLNNGYRVVINEGKHGMQSVNHLHIHFIGGQELKWPPGVETQQQEHMKEKTD